MVAAANAGVKPAAKAPANANNFVLTDLDIFETGGDKAKFKDNVAAIRLMKAIMEEQRPATPAEQAVLARYVGWGRSSYSEGLFGYYPDDKWAKEHEELKALLTDDEWESARASTQNAHYTTPRLATAMYDMARRLGFKGGLVNEPAEGTGLFFSVMPGDMRGKSSLVGSEMDKLTSNIAKLLHPDGQHETVPYQEANLPDDFFDLQISNYPFGDITIRQDKYNKVAASLHDYFFLKGISTVRPGGLLIAITSTGTMDKGNTRVREVLASKADLVAAMRLPGGAFLKNAGTDVVTDILILKRRADGVAATGPAWTAVREVKATGTAEPIPINEYFADHPEQVLGTLDRKSKLYGGGQPHVSMTDDFQERLQKAIARLPEGIYDSTRTKPPAPRQVIAADSALKDYGYEVRNGKELWQRQGTEMVKREMGKEKLAQVGKLLGIRDAMKKLTAAELGGGTDAALAPTRQTLNRYYDDYVKKYGNFHTGAHKGLITDDPDWVNLLALEQYNPETKAVTKADIFSKRTVKALERKAKADSIKQAVGYSMNETGGIDPDRIGELIGKFHDEVVSDLTRSGMAFKTPDGGLELSDYYLSGNVRAKLIQAEAAAKLDPAFKANVEALTKVIPEDKPHSEIDVKLGSPWVPGTDYGRFFAALHNSRPESMTATYLQKTGRWLLDVRDKYLKNKASFNETYGTPKADFQDIVQSAMDDKPIMLYSPPDRDGKRTFLADESAAANLKVEEVRELFKEWVWQDDERRGRLARFYNDNYNNIVETHHNGAWLEFPTMAAGIVPYDHQINAVARVMHTRRMLAGHEVGTGKTLMYGMIAAKMKELGYANKPGLAVLKSNIEQVTDEIQRAFPTMKILSTNENFDSASRRKTIARIATGDWDLVILTHDNMNMMDVDKDVEEGFIREEIAELSDVIRAAEANSGGGNRYGRAAKKDKTTKQLEKLKERLEEKLKEALARPRDPAITFQKSGIDMLMVDEAHIYKSLPVYTSRGSVKGIPQSRSDRATNLLMNTRWMRKNNPKAVMVFGTGTPIDNSMVELYNWQKYLQPEELIARGIESFDGWANTFGQTVTQVEPTAASEFKATTRFKRFTNLSELSGISRQMLDTRFVEDMPNIKRPKKIDAVVKSDMNSEQAAYMREIAQRAKDLKGKKVVKGGDNMLAICTDGRKAALHMGLISPNYKDNPDGKVAKAIASVLENHQSDPTATQMIFLDMGVNPTDWGFSLYKYIIDGLVKGGIPRNKIIDFTKLKEGDERLTAIARLRNADALVGIGSTPTMGTGVNAQNHLRWLHHIDAPRSMSPGGKNQRNGRAWRQGNRHAEIGASYYVTEGSLDAFVWSLINNKDAFIKQYLKYGTKLREIEEIDAEEISAARVMAEATGNPDVLNAVETQENIKKLEQKKRIFQTAQARVQSGIDSENRMIARVQSELPAFTKDAEAAKAVMALEAKPFDVGGKTYTEQKEPLKKALETAVDALINGGTLDKTDFPIASVGGFTIIARMQASDYRSSGNRVVGYYLRGANSYEMGVGTEEGETKDALSIARSALGTLRSVANGTYVQRTEQQIASSKTNIETLQKQGGKKYDADVELTAEKRKLSEIMSRLAKSSKDGGSTDTDVKISAAEQKLEDLTGPNRVNQLKEVSEKLGWPPEQYLSTLTAEIAAVEKKQHEGDEKADGKDKEKGSTDGEPLARVMESDRTNVAKIGVPEMTAQYVVNEVKKNGKFPADVRLVTDVSKVPEVYRNKQGYYDWATTQSVVIVPNVNVLNGMTDAQAVFRVLTHEGIHEGIEAARWFVEGFEDTFKTLSMQIPDEELATLPEAYKLAHPDYLRDPEQRATMFHELIAKAAENRADWNDIVKKPWWIRLVNAMRAWLRKTFGKIFPQDKPISQKIVDDMIKMSNQGLRVKDAGRQAREQNGFPQDTATPMRDLSSLIPKADTFYSALTKTVEGLPQEKFSPQQLKGMLAKAPGVKQDERKWTGIDVWLDGLSAKGQFSVTKAEALEFLRENQVRVTVTDRGERDESTGDGFAITDDETSDILGVGETEEEAWDDAKGQLQGRTRQELNVYPVSNELMDEINDQGGTSSLWGRVVNGGTYHDEGGAGTKFKGYMKNVPTDEGYGEAVFNLPVKHPFKADEVRIERNRRSVTQGEYTIYYAGKKLATMGDDIQLYEGEYRGLPDSRIIEIAKHLYEKGNPNSGIKKVSGDFTVPSAHQYGDESDVNQIARVIYSTMTLPDGSKGKVALEMQGDWAQKAKKEGDISQRNLTPQEQSDFEDLQKRYRAAVGVGAGTAEGLNREEQDRYGAYLRRSVSGVPDAPLIQKHYELSLKWLLRQAVEEGKDFVGWNAGSVVAERYDLSKEVDEVELTRMKGTQGIEKKWAFRAKKNGDNVLGRGVDTEKELADYIGKDPARKLFAKMEDGKLDVAVIEGDDLKVGGRWSEQLYDKMLVDYAKKYVKQWGGTVETANAPTNLNPQKDFGTFLKESGLQAQYESERASGKEYTQTSAYQKWYESNPDTVPLHIIKLTPSMKADVLTKGQSLFARSAIDEIEGPVTPRPVKTGGGKTPPPPGKLAPPSSPADEPDRPTPVARTPAELDTLIKTHTPGLGNNLKEIKDGLLSVLLPTAISKDHLRVAEMLGARLGEENHRAEALVAQLKPARLKFTKLGLDRPDLDPTNNAGLKFMSDMSQGREITGDLKLAADLIRKQQQRGLQLLAEAGVPVEKVRENYFKGAWTLPSRQAFNAALEEAVANGTFPENADLNLTTPEQRKAIRERVNQFLEGGKGSNKDMLAYLVKRPMEGKESFRKAKVFDDIMTGAEFGLRPVSYNPIMIHKLAMAEMGKSILANQFFNDLKKVGWNKFLPWDYTAPEGWGKTLDKYGTVYNNPTVGVEEHVDKGVYEGMMKVAEGLGLHPKRVMSAGRGRLGYASAGGETVTQFATELSVLAHEIGHQLDFKYGLWQRIAGTETPSMRTPVQNELRALSDLTWEGYEPSKSYKAKVRKTAEKMAHMLEAYIHAPEKFKAVAPTVYGRFDHFIRNTPELKALADIKPGLSLTKLTNEKSAGGLPIAGYHIFPQHVLDILDNYLSSSLYNTRFIGKPFTAWMAAANVLNQTQLGGGSFFHAGFTTNEAQISSGANLIKDIYGVMVGNRTATDLAKTAGRFVIATYRVPALGDKVLNAWRNPDGPMDPAIAAIVRGVELGGGGFKLEKGLQTEQSEKLASDWYSDKKLKAALRSPVAFTELLAKLVMEIIVPHQKAGVVADLIGRIIEQNPGVPLEELTPQFRQAVNRVDSRLGQVNYPRLFVHNWAKGVLQAGVRAPGWSGGTIAEIFGAFPDAYKFFEEWAKTGKAPKDIPDRVAYTMSLVIGMAVVNAVLTYLLTGETPHGMDYFAFRNGVVDEKGRAIRWLLPTYMKDLLAYYKDPTGTLLNKTHPLASLINDVAIKNQDYFGTEIHHPDDNVLARRWQDTKYVAKAFVPFWIRNAMKAHQQGSNIGATAASFIGVTPAPVKLIQTDAQKKIAEIMAKEMAGRTRTQEEADLAATKKSIYDLYRTDPAAARAQQQELVQSGQLTKGQEKWMEKNEKQPDAMIRWVQSSYTHPTDILKVYELATPSEREAIYTVARRRLESYKKTNRIKGQELLEKFDALDDNTQAEGQR